MDNQEQLSATSRAEYIRLARESCARNLGMGNGANKNHGGKFKENRFEKQGIWAPPDIKNFEGTDNGEVFSPSHLKVFLIRTTIALVLFLSVFLVDKFEIKVSHFNSSEIQQWIATNQGIEEAQDFFVSLYEQFAKAGK